MVGWEVLLAHAETVAAFGEQMQLGRFFSSGPSLVERHAMGGEAQRVVGSVCLDWAAVSSLPGVRIAALASYGRALGMATPETRKEIPVRIVAASPARTANFALLELVALCSRNRD